MRSSMKNKTKLRRRSFLPQFMTCIGGLCMAKAQYNADSITVLESCVQNYFFTPEIGIVKQLKNNEVWYIFMAFSKALKKATELAKSNFTNM